MTASEFSFLALGLVLGLVSGAALVELVRARSPSAHEVRLTVSHDAIPRRATTLADDAFVSNGPEPARGGPADRRLVGGQMSASASDRRTTVRFATATAPTASMGGGGASMVGIPISSGDDPTLGAFRRSEAPHTGPDGTMSPGTAPTPNARPGLVTTAMTAVALLDRSGRNRKANPTADPAATELCAEERRIAEERCELATRTRARATETTEALRVAQRAYDEHEAAAVTAAWRADPRAVHDAKDAAQGGFRAAVAAATTPDSLEAAARDWLTEINRINTDSREATVTTAREHAAAAEIGTTLERLGLEADAARIGAENADAACLSARVAVADCDERPAAVPEPDTIPPGASDSRGRLEEDETLGMALESGGAPRIFRLLRGDRGAMATLVTGLAGDDADARRRWQMLMTSLVEAIVADAIEASALDFPDGHPFWSPFTRTQDRDIVHALSSLGYRFDGLGGWTDGRQPSQRDLSLALGYAGLDPMRVRHWPSEEATGELFRDVAVAADEYLARIAGDLTLAEMVTMLGRRADGLAEVWNNWGRIRPLLLDET